MLFTKVKNNLTEYKFIINNVVLLRIYFLILYYMEFFKILYNEISKIINIELFFTLVFIVLNILIILIIAKKINKKSFDIRYESEEEKRYLIPIITITSICGFIVLYIARLAVLNGINK